MIFSADQVRLWNIRYLAAENRGLTNLAKRLDRAQPLLSAYIGKNPYKGIGSEFCRYVESKLRLERGWVDEFHPELWRQIDDPRWRAEIVRLLPPANTLPPPETVSPLLAELIEEASALPEEQLARLSDLARALAR